MYDSIYKCDKKILCIISTNFWYLNYLNNYKWITKTLWQLESIYMVERKEKCKNWRKLAL